MSRRAAIAGLSLSALLGVASLPAVQPARTAPELALVGAGEVVPPGYSRVVKVLDDRATDLTPTLRQAFAEAIAEESARAGFDPLFVLAVIDVESDFLTRSVSAMGARGLMQIRPGTLAYLAEQAGIADLGAAFAEDPALDVRLGVRYLRDLKDRFGTLDRALLAYNLGPAKMLRVSKEKGLDQYRGYLRAVKRDYAELQREAGEPDDWALASR